MGKPSLCVHSHACTNRYSAVNRLHGTWVPGVHVDTQRELDFTLPVQPALVQKIMASRFRHFVDVFTTRPRSRDKTLAERLVFTLLLPLSWVVLAFAVWDVSGHYDNRYGNNTWLSTVRSAIVNWSDNHVSTMSISVYRFVC
jgi:hypothetical protein